ncbi:hypothetical protein AB0478_31445 [Streptomyces sp. NPDC051917]|uniref:hypothetical protein n=1 Tax=Streptomyces sp. NPDC051917 TaxID=3154754 RepID=UPI00344E884A
MDEGMATAVAGAAGLVGAVFGGGISGWFTKKAADRGAVATAQAARDTGDRTVQAAIEGARRAGFEATRHLELQTQHAQRDWLFQRRVDALVGFMEAYDVFARATPAYYGAIENDTDRGDIRATIGAAQLGVTQAHFRILAFGPEHLRNPSGAVREALEDYTDALSHWDRAEEGRAPARHRLGIRVRDAGAIMAQAHSDFVDEVTAYIGSTEAAGGGTG